MSHCLVYRSGKAKVIRGVECDFKRVSLGEKHKYLADGWVGTVQEVNQEIGHTEESLKSLHYKKIDAILLEMGLEVEGQKPDKIKAILEAQQ